MALKKFKPTTAGQRQLVLVVEQRQAVEDVLAAARRGDGFALVALDVAQVGMTETGAIDNFADVGAEEFEPALVRHFECLLSHAQDLAGLVDDKGDFILIELFAETILRISHARIGKFQVLLRLGPHSDFLLQTGIGFREFLGAFPDSDLKFRVGLLKVLFRLFSIRVKERVLYGEGCGSAQSGEEGEVASRKSKRHPG